MRCGGKKLLAGALALFAAVNLGRLAAELSDRGKLAQRLDQAIEAEKVRQMISQKPWTPWHVPGRSTGGFGGRALFRRGIRSFLTGDNGSAQPQGQCQPPKIKEDKTLVWSLQ